MTQKRRELYVFYGSAGCGKTTLAKTFDWANWNKADANSFADFDQEKSCLLMIRHLDEIPERYRDQVTKWYCFRGAVFPDGPQRRKVSGLRGTSAMFPDTSHFKRGEYIVLEG